MNYVLVDSYCPRNAIFNDTKFVKIDQIAKKLQQVITKTIEHPPPSFFLK